MGARGSAAQPEKKRKLLAAAARIPIVRYAPKLAGYSIRFPLGLAETSKKKPLPLCYRGTGRLAVGTLI
ncbi:hypothetical protein GCM10020370_49040 [Paenibacillus hodogayensis]